MNSSFTFLNKEIKIEQLRDIEKSLNDNTHIPENISGVNIKDFFLRKLILGELNDDTLFPKEIREKIHKRYPSFRNLYTKINRLKNQDLSPPQDWVKNTIDLYDTLRECNLNISAEEFIDGIVTSLSNEDIDKFIQNNTYNDLDYLDDLFKEDNPASLSNKLKQRIQARLSVHLDNLKGKEHLNEIEQKVLELFIEDAKHGEVFLFNNQDYNNIFSDTSTYSKSQIGDVCDIFDFHNNEITVKLTDTPSLLQAVDTGILDNLPLLKNKAIAYLRKVNEDLEYFPINELFKDRRYSNNQEFYTHEAAKYIINYYAKKNDKDNSFLNRFKKEIGDRLSEGESIIIDYKSSNILSQNLGVIKLLTTPYKSEETRNNQYNLSLKNLNRRLNNEELRELKEFNSKLYTSYLEYVNKNTIESNFLKIVASGNLKTDDEHQRIRSFIKENINSESPLTINPLSLSAYVYIFDYKNTIDDELYKEYELDIFEDKFKASLDDYINTYVANESEEIPTIIRKDIINQLIYGKTSKLFSDEDLYKLYNKNILGIKDISELITDNNGNKQLKLKNSRASSTISALKDIYPNIEEDVFNPTEIEKLLKELLRLENYSLKNPVTNNAPVGILEAYINDYIKMGKLEEDPSEDLELQLYIGRYLIKQFSSNTPETKAFLNQETKQYLKNIFGNDIFDGEKFTNINEKQDETRKAIEKISPELYLCIPNSRNLELVTGSALSPELRSIVKNKYFSKNEIQTYIENYISSDLFEEEKGTILNTKIRELLIHQLRNSYLTSKNANNLNTEKYDFIRIDDKVIAALTRKDHFFKALKEENPSNTLTPDNSAITTGLIDSLNNANTSLPTTKNLRYALKNITDSNLSDTGFSNAIWKEYFAKEIHKSKESSGTYELPKEITNYIIYCAIDKNTENLISDEHWDFLLEASKMKGVIIPKEGFKIIPTPPSLTNFEDEYTRRRFLRKISPDTLKAYLSHNNRKEDDERLNKTRYSSEEQCRSIGADIKKLFSSDFNDETIKVITENLEKIDKLYNDEIDGLYRGVLVGNGQYAMNIANILKLAFDKLTITETPKNVIEKILKPVLVHNLKKLANPEIDIKEKGLLITKLAQGLGDCSAPFIDLCVLETLTIPENERVINKIELIEILEDKALQNHFKKLITKELRKIKEDPSLKKEDRDVKKRAVKLEDEIEGVVGAVLLIRGAQMVDSNSEPVHHFSINEDNNTENRTIPSAIRGMPKARFQGTMYPEYALSQLKGRQIELLIPTICLTDKEGKPIISEHTDENGNKTQYYTIDKDKVDAITRRETLALELADDIKPETISLEIKNYVEKLALGKVKTNAPLEKEENERIRKVSDLMFIEEEIECDLLFSPQEQQKEFIKKLKKYIKANNPTIEEVDQYVETYKKELRKQLVSKAQEILETPYQELSIFMRATNQDEYSVLQDAQGASLETDTSSQLKKGAHIRSRNIMYKSS